MQYTSPFYIFADQDLDGFSIGKAQKWYEALLTKLKQSGESSIEINANFFDENDIHEDFERIRKDPDFHLKIYENKFFLAFLENGDLDFFKVKNSFLPFENSEFQEKIKPYFIHQLSEVYYNGVTQVGLGSIKKLEDLQLSGIEIPVEFEQNIFNQTRTYLSNFISEAEQELADPFKENGKGLKEGAMDYFSMHLLQVFQKLPSSFNDLKERYGIVAHNYLVRILKRQPDPRKTSREVARVLLTACKIDAGLRNDSHSKMLIPTFENIIAQKPLTIKRFTGHRMNSPWIMGGTILFFVIFFAWLGNKAGGCHIKSDYEKSVDRYNYQRKKAKRDYEKIKNRTILEPEDILGQWKSDFFVDKTRILRTIDFYDKRLGKTTYQFVTTTGEERCRMTAWFYYSLKENKRNLLETFLYSQHQMPLEIGGNPDLLTEKERKVFEELKVRLEYEEFEEFLIYEPGDDEFKLAGKEYDQEERYASNEDLPEGVQQKIVEIEREEWEFELLVQQFAGQFILSEEHRGNFVIEAQSSNRSLVITHGYGKKEIAAKIRNQNGENFLVPEKWTKGKGYHFKGIFKNVKYIKKEEEKEGDLELMYHYSRSFRFREPGMAEEETNEKKK